MNKFIRRSLLLMALIAGGQSYATMIPGMANHDEFETTMLAYLNVKHGNKLQVKNAQGQILYKEKIKNIQEFENRFNLSFLPDGEYFIELDRKSETMVVPVDIVLNQVTFRTKSAYIVKTKAAIKAEKPVQLELGIPRKGTSFKGGNYLEYLKK